MRLRGRVLTGVLFALLAVAVDGRASTVKVTFGTVFNDKCTVYMRDPARQNQFQPIASIQPGPNQSSVVVIDAGFRTDNSIAVTIENTGGKPVEVIGNWSINATCRVSLDDRVLVEKHVEGWEPRNKTWSAGTALPFTLDQIAGLSVAFSPEQIAQFLATNQQQLRAAGLTNLEPLVGQSSGALGQVTPLVPLQFQMPIGNNVAERRLMAGLSPEQQIASNGLPAGFPGRSDCRGGEVLDDPQIAIPKLVTI